jgi:ribosomal protein L17
MAETLDELLAEVTDANTTDDSLIALCDTLKHIIDTTPNAKEAIRQISELVTTGKQKVVDAVNRNTPADPNPNPTP